MYKINSLKATQTITRTPRTKKIPGSSKITINWINVSFSSDKPLAHQKQNTKSTENQSTSIVNKIESTLDSSAVHNSVTEEEKPQLPSFSGCVTPLPQDNKEHNVPPISNIIYNLLQRGRDVPLTSTLVHILPQDENPCHHLVS